MGRKERLKELYEKVDKVQPFAEKDGHMYVSFEDAAVLNSYNADEPKTGMQTRNIDGSLASTGKSVHAINPNLFYSNRYKVKGKKLHLVSGHTIEGYRCIKEQKTGRIFLKTVPVYVISREADKTDENGNKVPGELVVEKMTTCPDTEFISEFTESLTPAAMAGLLPKLIDFGADRTATEMPI